MSTYLQRRSSCKKKKKKNFFFFIDNWISWENLKWVKKSNCYPRNTNIQVVSTYICLRIHSHIVNKDNSNTELRCFNPLRHFTSKILHVDIIPVGSHGILCSMTLSHLCKCKLMHRKKNNIYTEINLQCMDFWRYLMFHVDKE